MMAKAMKMLEILPRRGFKNDNLEWNVVREKIGKRMENSKLYFM